NCSGCYLVPLVPLLTHVPLLPYTTVFRSPVIFGPKAKLDTVFIITLVGYSLPAECRNSFIELNFQLIIACPAPPEKVELSELKIDRKHTSELQSRFDIVCRLLLEKKNENA